MRITQTFNYSSKPSGREETKRRKKEIPFAKT